MSFRGGRIRPEYSLSVGGKISKQKNWPYEPTSFDALAFTGDGSIIVASSDYGLLKYSRNQWSRLTPTWPGDLSTGHFALMKDSIAVIPVYNRAIAKVDLNTSAYKLVIPRYCR